MSEQVTLDGLILRMTIENLADKVYSGTATEEEEKEFFKYVNDEV